MNRGGRRWRLGTWCIYNSGRIRFAGETAAKVRNRELARYFWKEDETGSTWELMYFIVNDMTAAA